MTKKDDYIWEDIVFWAKRGESLDSLAARHPSRTKNTIRRVLVEKYGFSFRPKTSLDLTQRQKVLKDHDHGYSVMKIAERNKSTYSVVYRFLKNSGKKTKTTEIPRKMFKRYINGEDIKPLSKEFGISDSAFYYHLKKKGILREYKKISNEEHEKIISLYKQKTPPKKIAETMGISIFNVEDHIKKSGINRDLVKRMSEEEIDKAIQLSNSGYSVPKIAKAMNRSEKAIRKHLKKKGIKTHRKELSSLDVLKILDKLYNGEQVKSIAEEFNVCSDAIEKIAKGKTHKNVRSLLGYSNQDFREARKRNRMSI